MRHFVELLREQGEIRTIPSPLDPRYEISTVLAELGRADWLRC